MKPTSQMLRQRMHALARQKVRDCTQPGTVLSLIENEMQTLLTHLLNEKLQQEQAELLARPRYHRGAAGRYRNGYKPVRLSGLFRALRLRRPVLRRQTPPSPILGLLRSSNFIERFIRELRRRLRPAGTMHSEDELWKLLAATSIHQEQRWQKRKTHAVKELKQAA